MTYVHLKETNLRNDRLLSFGITQEKQFSNNSKKLVAYNTICEETRKSLKLVGTRLSF